MDDPDFFNRQYNARLAIPDHLQYFSRWDRQGRQVRAEEKRAGRVKLDLAYGSQPSETLDLFVPHQEEPPLLVFFHGGYWRSLDKKDFSWIAPPWLEEGIAVAIPNYALLPTVSLSTIVMQAVHALAWLWRAGPRQGYNRRKMVVAGHSAGGHLTAMAMTAIWQDLSPELPSDLVKGGVSMSGLHDLTPLMQASFIADDLNLSEEEVLRCSPAFLPQHQPVPFLTAVGAQESEGFHHQSALLQQAWPETFQGHLSLEDTHHLGICDQMAQPDSPLFEAILGLIRRIP